MGFFKDIGNALLGGIPSLIGDGIGALSQASANKTNMKINQMNNEFNERMMDKQIAYEKEMWDKNNAYNDPSQQVKRLESAGINPSMALGNVSPGSASSGSVGQASASSPLGVQPFRPDTSSFVDMMSSLISNVRQSKVDAANINFMEAQSDYLRAKSLEEIRGLNIDNNWKDRLNQIDYDYKNSQIGYNRAQESYTNILEDYQLMVNAQVPAQLAAQLSLIRAQVGNYNFMSQTEIGKLIDDYEKRFGVLPNSAKKILFGLDKLGGFAKDLLPLRGLR